MKISEHANYLLNEYGRLQFDYAAYCKPDGESLRNEARNNLEEYIAELEEENDRLQSVWFVEETICPDGSLKPKVSTLLSRIAELEAAQRWVPVSEPPKECEMRVFKDGNAWCFVLPDFQDLQVSPSVWMKKGVLDKIYKELRSVRDE
jgi:hypothetical protein